MVYINQPYTSFQCLANVQVEDDVITPGPPFIIDTIFPGIGIPIIKVRGSRDRFIFIRHLYHDDVIKWKHFPRNWPFVRGIHRSPVNFPHKGQWRGALMFTLICARMYDWVNTREAGDLRRYRPHYDVIVMILKRVSKWSRFRWHYHWFCIEYLGFFSVYRSDRNWYWGVVAISVRDEIEYQLRSDLVIMRGGVLHT